MIYKLCLAVYFMVNINILFDFILHVDKYLDIIIQNFGIFSYIVLFLVIFIETGLIIMPFLPGDSLIFIVGAFAAKGSFNIFIIYLVFLVAAILGDSLNYWIGSYFGERIFYKWKFFKKEYLDKTKNFYKKHGGEAIILARFVPIVRTFAPFVAGIGEMNYKKFLRYNIIGGFLWVTLLLFAGYFFGRLEWVEKNLTIVIYLIIFISLIPVIIEYLMEKRKYK